MRLQSIHIQHYRNITSLDLDCAHDLTILVGDNAQGKTNLLEAIYVLALGKSHRVRSHRDLIQFAENQSRIKGLLDHHGQSYRLEVYLTPKGKRFVRNGISESRLSQYIGLFPVVLFAPEDLKLVKGSPQVRRQFIDIEIGQVSPNYVYSLNQYHRVLTQRNNLLKQLRMNRRTDGLTLLDVLDEQLIDLAFYITKKRDYFIHALSKWSQEIHCRITEGQEKCTISYAPSVTFESEMEKLVYIQRFKGRLAKEREREIASGSTSVGTHRDDLTVMVNGQDLLSFGSQGQQRTAALSLKLAVLEFIREESGTYPVLLLDDVLSELDDIRKTHLLTAFHNRVQTYVTTTSLSGIDPEIVSQARIYEVNQGEFTKLEVGERACR